MDTYDKYWIHNEMFYDHYMPKCDNIKHMAINLISKEARMLCNTYANKISHSESLSVLLSNKSISEFYAINNSSKTLDDMISEIVENELEFVEDFSVKEDVQATIDNSLEYGHLIYTYHEVPKYKEVRVRILSNIIWDKITTLKQDLEELS